MISQKSVEEVIETARVEEVVSDYLTLKRRGVNLIGLCPFHNEKTPSFTVSPTKNIYKCFGCGKAGGSVQFLMEHDNLSFVEAIRTLAKKYNIQLEETFSATKSKEEIEKLESLYIINEFAQKYYRDQLDTDFGKSVALGYFTQRGFRKETLKAFGLGYAPNQKDGLLRLAQQKGYKIEKLREAGLLNQYDTDFFRNRVIFSLYSISGRVIGFAGRILSADAKAPKYINTPETEIYHKRKFLYGLHLTKEHIRRAKNCLIVEGYTDVMTLYQNDIRNVVAASGTSLTEEQVRLIKRYSENVTMIFDGDPAGLKAALRAVDIVLAQGLNVRVVLLPEGEDPDGYLKSIGAEAFADYIESKSEDFILFKTKLLLADAEDNPLLKAQVAKDIVASIALIPALLKRSIYVKECARLMGLDEIVLMQELKTAIATNLKKKKHLHSAGLQADSDLKTRRSAPTQKKETTTDYFQEKALLEVLLKFTDKIYLEEDDITVFQYVLEMIEDVKHTFNDPLFKKIIDHCYTLLDNNKVPNSAYFLNHEDKDIRQFAIEASISPYTYSENWSEKFQIHMHSQKAPDENYHKETLRTVLRFKLRKFDHLIKQNQATIAQTESDAKDSDRLLTLLKLHKVLLEQRKIISDRLGQIVLS